MAKKKSIWMCSEGHEYDKNIDPGCPVCEAEDESADGFLSHLAAPARRALANAGIYSIHDLSQRTEAEIRSLHGMGPSSIPKLQFSLRMKGLSFKS